MRDRKIFQMNQGLKTLLGFVLKSKINIKILNDKANFVNEILMLTHTYNCE